jgi:hypothetical protein
MNTQIISYSSGHWQALDRNGRVLREFSAGPDGRLAALKQAAGWRNPLILAAAQAIIDRHQRPEVTSRVWRAVELVASEQVYAPVYGRNERELCRVQSSEAGHRYPITIHDGRLHCNCADYFNLAPVIGKSKMCKHIFAATIALLAEIHPTPYAAASGKTFYSADEMVEMKHDADRLWRAIGIQTRQAAGFVPAAPAAPAETSKAAGVERVPAEDVPEIDPATKVALEMSRERSKGANRAAAFRRLRQQELAAANAVLFGE